MAKNDLPMLMDRQVRDQPPQPDYLRAQAGPDAFGEPIARALQNTGGTVVDIAIREKQKADAFAAADLDAQFSKEASDLLYNGKSGFLSQQGDAALDTAPVAEGLAKLQQKYAAKARSTDQQHAFMVRSTDRIETYTKQIESHSGQQRQAYYANTAAGVAAEALREAAITYGTPEEVLGSVQKSTDRALRLLRLQWVDNEHLSPEAIAQRENKFRSDMYSESLNTYLGKDQGLAGLKFLNIKGVREQLGPAAADFEKKLRPVADKEIGETVAERAFQDSFGQDQLPENVPSVGFAQERLRELATKNKFTWDQFEAASQGLDRRIRRQQAGFEEDTNGLTKSGVAFWEQGNHDLGAIPKNLEEKLKQRGAYHQIELMDAAWKQHKAGEPANPTQVTNFIQAVLDLERDPHLFDTYTAEDLRQKYGPYLHVKDLERFGLEVARKQGRPERWTEGIQQAITLFHQLGASSDFNLFPSLRDPDPKKRDPATWSDKERAIYYFGVQEIQDWYKNWHSQKQTGPVPDMKEIREMLDGVLWKGRKGTYTFAGKTTLLQSKALGEPFVPDRTLPEAVMRGVRAAWSSNPDNAGKPPPSDAELQRAYLEMEGVPAAPNSPMPPGFRYGY